MSRVVLALALMLVLSFPVAAVDPKELKPGLVVTYTEFGGDIPNATVTRLEPTVGVTLGAGESPHPRLARGDSAIWSGSINVVQAGTYTFAATVRGGRLTVTVGGRPVLDAGADGVGKEVRLDAGVQPFRATFTASPAAGARQVELRWHGPGFRVEPVPYSVFGHLPKDRPETFAKDVQLEYGRFLFEELACIKCHKPAADAMAKTLAERTGPNLSDIGRRVYPGWLDAWLADPHKIRPQAQMPKLFAADDAGRAERYAVVQYLTSLGGPLPEPRRRPLVSNEYRRSVTRGEALFVTTGCAACHGKQLSATRKKSDDDEDEKPPAFDPLDSFTGLGTSTGPQWLYALGALGSKTRPDVLAKYLQDPLKTNPHGRMPNMQLGEQDARDLATYLCRVTDDAIVRTKRVPGNPGYEKLKVADQWRELGRRLVVAKGCVNCHVIEEDGKPLPEADHPPPLSAVRAVKPGAGCLSAVPDGAKVPVYALEARHRDALAAFLKDGLTGAGAKAPPYAARVALKRFNCLNCHQRDGEGGIGGDLADRMRLLDRAENAEDVQPPRLTQIGHKATPAWLQSVLTGGGRARPWMTLRMPQYGPHNVGFLADALPAAEGTTADADAKPPAFTAEKLEAGRTLAGKNGLGCISCHDISGVVGGGTRGPDLALNSRRVRYDWFARWMHNPQRLAPGTRMPQNFNDGKSVLPAVYGGDGDRQIDALWSYLALGPGLPLPAGLEPPKGLVIAVKDRPEILRTFLPDGAGTRAVAVGYPGGVSLAFDAHACRLSYAWEGNFLDAGPVWNNRGGNPAKLLGAKFLTAPPGHPWAVTPDRHPPDFLKRADDYAYGAPVPDNTLAKGPLRVKFNGYRTDPQGNPVFGYSAEDEQGRLRVIVSDKPTPVKSSVATGLTRTFVVNLLEGRTVWYHAGTSSGTPRVYGPTGAKVAVNLKGAEPETLAVGVMVVLPQDERATVLHLTAGPAGAAWRFVPRPGGGWLAVLRLPDGREGMTELALTTWALPRDDEGLLKALGSGK
jgi:cbb3-type cytochrome oxidase cytochrome c subunit